MTTHIEYLERTKLEEPWHARRYALSYEWISHLAHSSAKVCTLGGRSPFEQMLEAVQTELCVAQFSEDLRYIKANDSERNAFDLVLMMEVLEHIRDRDDTDIATFTASGVHNALRFAYDICKPGGHIFITTPNVCGYRNIWRLIHEHHPFMFPPHHREFSKSDVLKFIADTMPNAKVAYKAVDVWSNHGCSNNEVRAINKFIAMMGGNTSGVVRADDLFFLIQKGA